MRDHLLTFDEKDGFWRCSCPPGSVCPLVALHAAYAAFSTARRNGLTWSDCWTDEMEQASEMVGTVLYPMVATSDEERRMFARNVRLGEVVAQRRLGPNTSL